MKKLILIASIFAIVLGMNCIDTTEAYGATTVLPSKATVIIDGEEKSFEAYSIHGNNYFKLRDLALALNGNPKGFDAGWDENKKAVYITKGQAYTSNGAETTAATGAQKKATRSRTKVAVDGTDVELVAYNIEFNNYFKLRDIMKICGVSVDWDAKTNNVIVDTSKPYTTEEKRLEGMLICVDPGHGDTNVRYQEPIAPNVNIYKRAYATGTSGATCTEAQVNLAVGTMLRDKLVAEGASVIMTRTDKNSTMSNADRAVFANEAGVDMVIRIHCDGSTSKSATGMSLLVPGTQYLPKVLCDKSAAMGAVTERNVVQITGGKSRGVIVRNDLTGFNWSTVPVILIEMGFMTNPHEDSLLSSYDYQQKLATGLFNGMAEIYEKKLF